MSARIEALRANRRDLHQRRHRAASSLHGFANGSDQWLATKGFSMQPDFVESPLHAGVRLLLGEALVPCNYLMK
jgi:hypothetical protein